ncbi:MAG: WecB/TagA/CpsF family glycosyltransferase [Porticoccus sp.]
MDKLNKNNEVIELFGLPISNVSLRQASKDLVKSAVYNERRVVFFVNAHCANIAEQNHEYRVSLQNADLLYADGAGMRLAAKLSGQLLVDNVNGTDLFPLLCRDAAEAGVSIALLGAKSGVAERCAEKMVSIDENLKVVWTHHGYLEDEGDQSLILSLNESGAGILLVAMGVPRQELWIARHASELDVAVIMGTGALYDFYSGDVARAPKFMRKIGFEWMFRLILEPRRMFFRYVVGIPIFVFRILCDKCKKIIK